MNTNEQAPELEQPDKHWEGVTYQAQPTPKTCVHACLAMAMGVPVQRVIEAVGDEPLNFFGLHTLLDRFGLIWNACVYGTFMFNGWHFVSVPSLNMARGAHCILLWWDPPSGKIVVMDPSAGNRYASDGSDLKSWSQLTMFYPGGRIPRAGGAR